MLDLTPGTLIELLDGTRLTVTENMGDGQWVEASRDGTAGGDLVHSQDIARVVGE